MCIWRFSNKRLAMEKEIGKQGKGGAQMAINKECRYRLSSLLLSVTNKTQQSHIQPCLQGPLGYREVKGHRVRVSLKVFFVSKSCQTWHVNIYRDRLCRKHRERNSVSVLQAVQLVQDTSHPVTRSSDVWTLEIGFLHQQGAGSPHGRLTPEL